MAAICHCVFIKDENKTNEVWNYIGNKLAHITLPKTNIGIITKWGKKKIYKWLIYQTSLTLPPVINVPNASQNHRLYICVFEGVSVSTVFLLGKLTSSLYIDKLASSLYMYIDKFISHFWVFFMNSCGWLWLWSYTLYQHISKISIWRMLLKFHRHFIAILYNNKHILTFIVNFYR
jgi:hypothetical protein